MAITKEDIKKLEFMRNNARATFRIEGSSCICGVSFISVLKDMESYVEIIESNVSKTFVPNLKELLTGYLSVGEARDRLYGYFEKLVLDHIQESIGGVL